MKQYQVIYQLMIDQNHELFKRFFEIHEQYVQNPKANQDAFNTIGREIQDVVHDYERRLCGKTESGQYSKFSANLSDKFWGLLRKDYPKIDFIGIH
jgi:hypothetical protein